MDKDFKSNIEERLPESKFELYEGQKDGIAFLHGRNHAILGDETGFGKTITMISAAELKMQDLGPNSKTLIIGLKSIQKQWVEEIKNVIGENTQISEDGISRKDGPFFIMIIFQVEKTTRCYKHNKKSRIFYSYIRRTS